MPLIAKNIPPVSRAFALELQARFKPFTPTPGFDRDELMQSVGEQKIISWILYHSNNYALKSTYETSVIDTSNIDTTIDTVIKKDIVENPSSNWLRRFTTRFGN